MTIKIQLLQLCNTYIARNQPSSKKNTYLYNYYIIQDI